jgi:hypothetical protein
MTWLVKKKDVEKFMPILKRINDFTAKRILKQAIMDVSLPVKICAIKDLHPKTLSEIEGHIHQIQNILIAEYVRYTDLKDELGLQ